jgi:hypothetical protein
VWPQNGQQLICLGTWIAEHMLPAGTSDEQPNIPQVLARVNNHPPTGSSSHELCVTGNQPKRSLELVQDRLTKICIGETFDL